MTTNNSTTQLRNPNTVKSYATTLTSLVTATPSMMQAADTQVHAGHDAGSATSQQEPQRLTTHRGIRSRPATEPLGFSVDAMEPVGTHPEIQASSNRR